MSQETFIAGVKSDLLNYLNENNDEKYNAMNDRVVEIADIIQKHTINYYDEDYEVFLNVDLACEYLLSWSKVLNVPFDINNNLELLKTKCKKLLDEESHLMKIMDITNLVRWIILKFDTVVLKSESPVNTLSNLLHRWRELHEIGQKYPEYTYRGEEYDDIGQDYNFR